MKFVPRMSGEAFYQRVRQGHSERERVFRELFDDHALEFAARFRMAGLTPHQVEDQVQGLFTRLIEKWESLRGDVPPVHWLSRVASNAIADHFAARARNPAEAGGAAPGAGTGAGHDAAVHVPGPEAAADDPPHSAEPQRLAALCAKRALQAFCADHPLEGNILCAYAMGDLSIEAVMTALRCASTGAAAQRLSVWRGQLSQYCRRHCETPHCD